MIKGPPYFHHFTLGATVVTKGHGQVTLLNWGPPHHNEGLVPFTARLSNEEGEWWETVFELRLVAEVKNPEDTDPCDRF